MERLLRLEVGGKRRMVEQKKERRGVCSRGKFICLELIWIKESIERLWRKLNLREVGIWERRRVLREYFILR